MSDDQNEIDKIKTMLAELNKRVESKLEQPQNSNRLIEKKTDSEFYLRLHELQTKLDEASLDNQRLQDEIITLRKQKDDLEIQDNKKSNKINLSLS